jgi:hypothetical protein
MSDAQPVSRACFNCGTPLTGSFCPDCGQKSQPLNPRLADFLHELAHETLHVDGKFFRSVAKLLRAPGFLTHEYFEGRRARWVSPIRLYLVFALVYFAIASFAPPSAMRVTVTGDTDEEQAAALRQIGFQSEAELREAVNHAYATWAPRAMFVLLPLFAWLVSALLKPVGRNYPQHLYFALHVHAAWFAVGALGLLISLWLPPLADKAVSFAVLSYAVIYLILALMRAYGRTARQAFTRAAIVVPVYGISILLVIIVVLAVIFGRGAMG